MNSIVNTQKHDFLLNPIHGHIVQPMNIAEQIDQAMKAFRPKPMSQSELARRSGVPQATISRTLKGISVPETETLTKLAKALNIKFSHIGSTSNVGQAPDLLGLVPLISWVQAGNWENVIDNLAVTEGERIETTYRAKEHTYALRVKGDSMESKFPDGCIIIVEPDEYPRSGQYVIVRQNGDEATFKQYIEDGSSKLLKPLNPRYPIMEMRSDAVFCGVVKRMEMDI